MDKFFRRSDDFVIYSVDDFNLSQSRENRGDLGFSKEIHKMIFINFNLNQQTSFVGRFLVKLDHLTNGSPTVVAAQNTRINCFSSLEERSHIESVIVTMPSFCTNSKTPNGLIAIGLGRPKILSKYVSDAVLV